MLKAVAPIILRSDRSPSGAINYTQIRSSFYYRYKHGPQKISNPPHPYMKWLKEFFTTKEGYNVLKEECTYFIKNHRFKKINIIDKKLNKPYIFEHFDSDEAIQRWKPVADSDSNNGYSVSNLVRSPAGHALFKGILDNRIPDDGITQNSGFAGVIGPGAPRKNIMALESHWNWEGFNCVEIKFRGDGRKYAFVANTSSYEDDVTCYDNFFYPLYTRGGPYWQIYRIPFSKFLFCHKAFIQDEQDPVNVYNVKFVAFTIQDRIDGPFALEIDYIALVNASNDYEEFTAYESYSFPHITLRPLQVGCDPPDSE